MSAVRRSIRWRRAEHCPAPAHARRSTPSAAAEGRLVAGTGNRSEAYMGYFTKWGDGCRMTSTPSPT
ncbi:MAG: hypothetical protein ACLUNO_13130 [Oscillospiraceae bacterium]